MRIFNKIVATFLSVLIIMPSFITIVLAEANSGTKYLALGDSIAYGYGLNNIEEESYASLVREKQDIVNNNFSNLAISGMTCEEFYNIIQTDNYTNAIKKANLITVSIGSNELLGIAVSAVANVTGVEEDDPNFAEKVKKYFANLNTIQKIQVLDNLYMYFTSDEVKAIINQSINTYSEKWEQSIDYIKSINPDVIIVATEFYNPYYEIALASYDLGSYVDEYIQKMNNILDQKSDSGRKYKIAKIYHDFNTTNPRLTNVVVDIFNFDNMNIDPHPNKEGHAIIATRILDVLKNVEKKKKKDIRELVCNNITDYDYTGEEIKPKIIIKDGEKTLTENVDYTLTYINNLNIGQATILIKGIGKYTGTVTKYFNIKGVEKKEIKDINELTILDIEDQTYLGIKITPDVQIKTLDNKILKKDIDYNLKYYDNINVGKAKIEITGIGNYRGTKTVFFNIISKSISETTIMDISEQKYTGEEIKPKLEIIDGSANLIEGKDYEVIYENNIQVGVASIKISGKGNYIGIVNKSFRIISEEITESKKDISLLQISDIEDKIYTGKNITPEVEIRDSDKLLIKNQDYKLAYENNLNVGIGKVIIIGIGNYTNTIVKEFNIIKKDINYTQISEITDNASENEEREEEKEERKVIVSSDSIKLQEDEDYTVEHKENEQEGTETIEISGENNYTGKTVITYKNDSEKESEEESDKDEKINEDNDEEKQSDNEAKDSEKKDNDNDDDEKENDEEEDNDSDEKKDDEDENKEDDNEENDDNEKKDNNSKQNSSSKNVKSQDNTISEKKLPTTGKISSIILFIILLTFIIGVVSLYKYRRNTF